MAKLPRCVIKTYFISKFYIFCLVPIGILSLSPVAIKQTLYSQPSRTFDWSLTERIICNSRVAVVDRQILIFACVGVAQWDDKLVSESREYQIYMHQLEDDIL